MAERRDSAVVGGMGMWISRDWWEEVEEEEDGGGEGRGERLSATRVEPRGFIY